MAAVAAELALQCCPLRPLHRRVERVPACKCHGSMQTPRNAHDVSTASTSKDIKTASGHGYVAAGLLEGSIA